MSTQMHVLSGFVGGKPETREVEGKNGPQTVATMSVAVNNPRQKDAPPTWYRITMWNGLGTTVAQYVDKGSFVVVSGDQLRVSPYIDRDGNPQASLELRAISVDFSGNRRSGDDVEDGNDTDEIPF